MVSVPEAEAMAAYMPSESWLLMGTHVLPWLSEMLASRTSLW
jgi:hypothetical protein